MPDEELKYEKIQQIGIVSEGKKRTKELNIVKWGSQEPKFDLRNWNKEDGKPGKGVTLTADELQKLKEMLDNVLSGNF